MSTGVGGQPANKIPATWPQGLRFWRKFLHASLKNHDFLGRTCDSKSVSERFSKEAPGSNEKFPGRGEGWGTEVYFA